MVYQIVKNRIKPGTRELYSSISREFCDAMVKFGAKSAQVLFDDADENVVVNITVWKDRSQIDGFMASDIPGTFFPRLEAYFNGNESMILTEQV